MRSLHLGLTSSLLAVMLWSFAACSSSDDAEDLTPSPSTPSGEADARTVDADEPPGDTGAPEDAGVEDATPVDAGPDAALPTIDAGAPRLIEHIVAPKDADARVTSLNEDHYVYLDTTKPLRFQLVLWLTGASGIPKNEVGPLKESAARGFHAIGLRYTNNFAINGTSANDVCNTSNDPDCHGNVRLEALDGVDHSDRIAIPPQNSIEVRLAKLLTYMVSKFPGEGWEYYLDPSGTPKWSVIIAGGTSHGASAAGRISKARVLAGAVMSSGPFDSKGGVPATWTSGPSMTPVSKVFGLSHNADSQYAVHLLHWDKMKLPGAVTFVDGKPAPWGNSHRLTSARAGAGHGSMSNMSQAGYPAVWTEIFHVLEP